MSLNSTYLKSLLNYDPDTGLFIWIPQPGVRHGGKIAGGVNLQGYHKISIGKKLYSAARLAVLYMTGEWPEAEVDHINHIRHDNRWCNLRCATKAQNMSNRPIFNHNKTGYKGVAFNQGKQKYTASIMSKGKSYFLGYFDTKEEAGAAYVKKAAELHQEFSCIK